jgi:hypothetical protein
LRHHARGSDPSDAASKNASHRARELHSRQWRVTVVGLNDRNERTEVR